MCASHARVKIRSLSDTLSVLLFPDWIRSMWSSDCQTAGIGRCIGIQRTQIQLPQTLICHSKTAHHSQPTCRPSGWTEWTREWAVEWSGGIKWRQKEKTKTTSTILQCTRIWEWSEGNAKRQREGTSGGLTEEIKAKESQDNTWANARTHCKETGVCHQCLPCLSASLCWLDLCFRHWSILKHKRRQRRPQTSHKRSDLNHSMFCFFELRMVVRGWVKTGMQLGYHYWLCCLGDLKVGYNMEYCYLKIWRLVGDCFGCDPEVLNRMVVSCEHGLPMGQR